jgi:ribonuclease P protein subunit POP4
MITPKNIVRHELIGLHVEVIASTNKDQLGIKGRVIDETMNMIKIANEQDKEKVIQKKGSIFRFALPNNVQVDIAGDIIVARPEDRIKKRFKKW